MPIGLAKSGHRGLFCILASTVCLSVFCGCAIRVQEAPHPTKGLILLSRPIPLSRLAVDEEGEVEKGVLFYILYTQAEGMERNGKCRSALALYEDAASIESVAIKAKDRSAVRSRIAELREKIKSED